MKPHFNPIDEQSPLNPDVSKEEREFLEELERLLEGDDDEDDTSPEDEE